MNQSLLTTEEAAAFLHISPRTLIQWRTACKGPPVIRLGHRTVRYKKASLESWAGKQRITPAKKTSPTKDHQPCQN